MNNLDAISANCKALAQDAVYTAQIAAGAALVTASSALQSTWTGLEQVSKGAERVFRSPDAFNYSLLGITSAINSLSPFYSFQVSEKVFSQIKVAQFFISATRLSQSFDYFFAGKWVEDYQLRSFGKLIGESCFLFGRLGSTLNFMVQHNLADLTLVTGLIGRVPVFGALAINALTYPLIDLFFMGGMVALSLEKANNFFHGDTSLHNVVSLMSLVSETVLVRLTLAATVSPLLIAALGVVVAATGVASFLLEPEAYTVTTGSAAAAARPVVVKA